MDKESQKLKSLAVFRLGTCIKQAINMSLFIRALENVSQPYYPERKPKILYLKFLQTFAKPILRFRRSPLVEICTIGSCTNPLCWLRSPSGRLQFCTRQADTARWQKFTKKCQLGPLFIIIWRLSSISLVPWWTQLAIDQLTV